MKIFFKSALFGWLKFKFYQISKSGPTWPMTRDGNGSGSGRVDRKPDPRKNIVGLNLTLESEPVSEIWGSSACRIL
jgi:hypothetical protein